MFFVYVLKSQKDSLLYTGFTPNDPHERTRRHNNGLVQSTKPRIPLDLIYFEAYTNEQDATRRENYLKTTAGKRALKHMLRKTLQSNN
ncbi:GIY-YIG nuclease family protein [Candidatus Falkowbacteria bacterium]|nr:GIY-YIG nuclease family protein [Candidatus Falkowbacteria bacterium]MBT5502931.1 GIY-YIG nuclease family protein [Candidatus Falkowbacteria bacterium]MBT6574058.1 GIY-YIG nuclease family protein [Candidatus Falkowbacteria bacterium]MBT7348627.1 GIY-YIG nuclease family protein [Candidatus Falkowbacteria bacterium]MBT7500418.1 GIY-YIG nuclease family protein [Candidatus Falkowbacteria bacterium]